MMVEFVYLFNQISSFNWFFVLAATPRIIELAVPKCYEQIATKPQTEFGVVLTALTYIITDYMIKLSKRKSLVVREPEDDEPVYVQRELTQYGVSVNALTYEATKNIIFMSKPKELPEPFSPPIDNKKNTKKYSILEDVSNYESTDPFTRLAKPKFHEKEFKDNKERTTNNIVESALKYIPTDRILQLARREKSN